MVSSVQFVSELKRWTQQRLPEYSKAMQTEVATDLGTRIVQKTPVRTGLARGNMRLGIGKSVARGTLSRRDPSGLIAIAAIEAAAERLAPYSSFTIYNNLPYVPRLEDGWSRQAPLGMFRLSLREVMAEQSTLTRRVLKRIGGRFVVR